MTDAIRTWYLPWSFMGILFIVMTSCGTTKYLEDGQKLYRKTEVKLSNPELFTDKGKLTREVLLITQPKPNVKVNLRFYNFMGVPNKTKGLWHWLGKKFGEPPVLYDPVKTSRSQKRIESYLRNQGYFGASVQLDTLSSGRKIKALYTLTSRGQYTVTSFDLVKDTTEINELFQQHRDKTRIELDQPYNLAKLESERNRLTLLAQDNGYIRFTKDDLFYLADTTKGEYQVALSLYTRKKEAPDLFNKFQLGKTQVFINYDLRSKNQVNLDTIPSEGGLYFSNENKVVKNHVLERNIAQREGDLYSKSLQDVTFNRLQGLDLFKFVDIRYAVDSTLQNRIDRFIYLTPAYTRDLTAALELNNQAADIYGTSATLTYTNKNQFGGAERFNLSLSGGLATQLNTDEAFINTAQIDLKSSLSIPRLMVPFKTSVSDHSFIPRTLISAGVGYEERVEFYALQKAEFKFGYRWKGNIQEQHEFYPISFNMFKLGSSSDAFDDLRSENQRLDRSFENTMLGGLKYLYTYTNKTQAVQRNAYFFTGEVETSGNFLYLISRLGGGAGDDSFSLFGLPVTQFFKISSDYRHYTEFRKTTLVARIFAGVAHAYGNIGELPYSKQFVTGGANGLRAFPLRGLGPGSFIDEDLDGLSNQGIFLDQTGNLKLELNLEYRFPVFRFLKGAVFLDAGNIWLIDDDEIPEGNFQFNRFLKEIAIGTGVGLRLDFNYFVIRLDTAFPLRAPVSDQGFKWVLDEIDLLSQQWRIDNLKWHIAIGYPF